MYTLRPDHATQLLVRAESWKGVGSGFQRFSETWRCQKERNEWLQLCVQYSVQCLSVSQSVRPSICLSVYLILFYLIFSVLIYPPLLSYLIVSYPPTPALAKAGAAPRTTGGVEPALWRPWPSHCPRSFQQQLLVCVEAVCQASKASNAPRQLPRPNLPAGLSKATLAATRPKPSNPSNPSKPLARLSKATLASTRPSHLFLKAFKPAVCPPSNPSNPSNPPAGLSKATLAATRPSHLFLRAFKPPVCPPSNTSHPSNPPADLSKATLAATRPSHLFLRASKPAVCPPSNPSNPSNPPASLSAATLAATRPSHLFLRAFKPAVCPPSNPSNPSNPPASRRPFQGNSRSYSPQPSVFKGVQACRLPALKPFKPFKPSRRPFQGNSRSYTPQPSVFKGVQACRLPALKPFKPFKPSRRPCQGNSRSYTPQPSVFKGVQACRLPALKPFKPFRRPFQGNSRSYTPQPSVFKGVQACRLPALKPFKPFRRPFQGNSRSYTPNPWATRACDSPFLMGFLFWHVPFRFLAWFPSGRVMLDVNLPERTGWPHNSLTHRARVGMAPRLSADTALLHIELVAAHASMVYSPRFGVT